MTTSIDARICGEGVPTPILPGNTGAVSFKFTPPPTSLLASSGDMPCDAWSPFDARDVVKLNPATAYIVQQPPPMTPPGRKRQRLFVATGAATPTPPFTPVERELTTASAPRGQRRRRKRKPSAGLRALLAQEAALEKCLADTRAAIAALRASE